MVRKSWAKTGIVHALKADFAIGLVSPAPRSIWLCKWIATTPGLHGELANLVHRSVAIRVVLGPPWKSSSQLCARSARGSELSPWQVGIPW